MDNESLFDSPIADMKKARLALLASIPFLFSIATSASPADDPGIVGRWKRTKDNGEWVVYDYRRDGRLFRATPAHAELVPFGRYRLAGDVIHFEDSPEHYTPVRFVVETGSCSGHTGATLFLADQATGAAYGCYFRIDPAPAGDERRDLSRIN